MTQQVLDELLSTIWVVNLDAYHRDEFSFFGSTVLVQWFLSREIKKLESKQELTAGEAREASYALRSGATSRSPERSGIVRI